MGNRAVIATGILLLMNNEFMPPVDKSENSQISNFYLLVTSIKQAESFDDWF